MIFLDPDQFCGLRDCSHKVVRGLPIAGMGDLLVNGHKDVFIIDAAKAFGRNEIVHVDQLC